MTRIRKPLVFHVLRDTGSIMEDVRSMSNGVLRRLACISERVTDRPLSPPPVKIRFNAGGQGSGPGALRTQVIMDSDRESDEFKSRYY